jgi:putative oxidoreductase
METTMESSATRDGTALVGRILLASLFVFSGWGKLGAGFAGTAGYIASKGLPMPEVLAALAIAVELGGALLLIIGWKARWGALALALFTIVITPIFHAFWAVPADQVMMQTINFQKNVAIIGGLLVVWGLGPGRFSVDGA